MLTWKLRIAVLWIFFAVGESAAMVLLMFQPGVIRDMMAGGGWGWGFLAVRGCAGPQVILA